MCIKRFELIHGQFKHTRHWVIENILGFECEQHLLDVYMLDWNPREVD